MLVNPENQLAYLTLLKLLRYDASLKAIRYNGKTVQGKKDLNKIETNAHYAHLLTKLPKFEALERKKIQADLYRDNPEITYLVDIIGRKCRHLLQSSK